MLPPTAGELLRSTELTTETTEAAARFDQIMQTRVARINALLKGSPHVITPPVPRSFVPYCAAGPRSCGVGGYRCRSRSR
jgi:hypothetical protein